MINSENHKSDNLPENEGEIALIAPEDAAALLDARVVELQAEGWHVLVQRAYIARLTRGEHNLDVQVDLLGVLSEEEKPLTLPQEAGRLIGWVFLLVFVLLVLTIISSVGEFLR